MTISADELYGTLWAADQSAIEAELTRSLEPRGTRSLYDAFVELDVGPDQLADWAALLGVGRGHVLDRALVGVAELAGGRDQHGIGRRAEGGIGPVDLEPGRPAEHRPGAAQRSRQIDARQDEADPPARRGGLDAVGQ